MTMLKPLILTGLTPKISILVLHMLIWHLETLYGDKKEWVSTHEQAWASMSKHAKVANFNGFSQNFSFFALPQGRLTPKTNTRMNEHTWASISKHAEVADFNRFSTNIPYSGPPHAFWATADDLCFHTRGNFSFFFLGSSPEGADVLCFHTFLLLLLHTPPQPWDPNPSLKA